MSDSVESAYESLNKLDKALLSSSKNAATLSRGISKLYKLQETKKWEIFSRFISGSGLWKVQNKFRAIVQTFHQFADAGNKAAEASAKQLTQLTELSDSHKTLTEAQKMYSGTVTKEMGRAILKQEKYKELVADEMKAGKTKAEAQKKAFKQHMLDNSSKLRALAELTDFETARLKMLDEINIQVKKSDEVLQKEKAAMKTALLKEEAVKEKKALKKKIKAQVQLDKKNKVAEVARLKKHQKRLGEEFDTLIEKRESLANPKSVKEIKEYLKVTEKMGQISDKMDKTDAKLGKAKKGAIGARLTAMPGGIHVKKMARNIKKMWKAENKKKKAWKTIQTVGGLIKKAFMMMMPMLGYVILGIFAVIGIVALVKVVWDSLKATFEEYAGTFETIFNYIWSSVMTIYEGILDVWEAIAEGDWSGMLMGLLEIGAGIIDLAIGLTIAALLGLWVLFVGVWNTWWNWVKKDFPKRLLKTLLIALAIYLVWWLISAVAIATGLPILIVVGIAAAIMAFGYWIWKKIKSIFWHTGGSGKSGTGVVGERGPELVNVPSGTTVTSNKDLQGKVGKGGTIININVNGRLGASDEEIRDIARKLSKHIAAEVNRQTSSSA